MVNKPSVLSGLQNITQPTFITHHPIFSRLNEDIRLILQQWCFSVRSGVGRDSSFRVTSLTQRIKVVTPRVASR